jgi:hypothetical protein
MLMRSVVAMMLLWSVAPAVASAQTARPADAMDAVTALVAELRALRADLAAASERSLRFQLLLARLQLQEQRIGNLDRQHAEVVKSLMDVGTMTAMFASQLEQFERGCATATGEELKECESQVANMKATATTHQAREQQFRTQEQELAQAIAAEQGRWNEFSVRLDELERALARRP